LILQCDILPGWYEQFAWLLKHFVHACGKFAAIVMPARKAVHLSP
jgi:hypothetical protein